MTLLNSVNILYRQSTIVGQFEDVGIRCEPRRPDEREAGRCLPQGLRRLAHWGSVDGTPLFPSFEAGWGAAVGRF